MSPGSPKSPRRRPRAASRGLTLVELVVGTFIALFLTVAAMIFASHETKLLGYSTEQVDMQQQARSAIDLLTSDLQMAGAGIGYSPAGVFLGLQTNQFRGGGAGGIDFNANGSNATDLTLIAGDPLGGSERGAAYTLPTHDLGIVAADGTYATLAQHSGLAGEFCDPNNTFSTDQQLVVMRSEEGLTAQSILFTAAGVAGACTFGQCAPVVNGVGSGCRAFTLADDPNDLFSTDASAAAMSYTGGEVLTGFKQIVWFVNENPAPDENRATLRRMVFDGTRTCTDRATCGDEQSANIETLQYQVWRFNTTLAPPQWQAVAPGPIARDASGVDFRLRVDMELVVRARVSDGRRHDPVRLRLADACVPDTTPCGAPPTAPAAGSGDNIPRRAHRWTVEIRNSGRMMIRSLGAT